jgi:hypothetical protein
MYDLCPYLALRPKFFENLIHLLLLPLLAPGPCNIYNPFVVPDLSLPVLHFFHQLLSPPLLHFLLLLCLMSHSKHMIYLSPLQLFLSLQEHFLVPQPSDSVLKHLQLVLCLLLLPEGIQHHYTFLGELSGH